MQRRRTTRSSRIPGGRRGRDGRSHAPFGLPAFAPGTTRGRAGCAASPWTAAEWSRGSCSLPARASARKGRGTSATRWMRGRSRWSLRPALSSPRVRSSSRSTTCRTSSDGPRIASHGAPSEGMDVVGITGTNGKTTVAHCIARAFDTIGPAGTCAVMGTLGHGLPGALETVPLTTPDGPRRAPEPGRDAARGCAPSGDGGVVARDRAGPNRRGPVQGRLPHQRRTRSPRLPRERRGVRGGEAPAVHVAGTGGGGHQRGRPVRPGHSRVGAGPSLRLGLRAGRSGRGGTRPARTGPHRPNPARGRPWTRTGDRRQPARGPVQRLQPARLCRRSPRDGHTHRAGRGGTRRGRTPSGKAATGGPRSAGPVGSRALRRLRPHARRAGRGAVRPSTPSRKGKSGSCSDAEASAIRASERSWGPPRPVARSGCS